MSSDRTLNGKFDARCITCGLAAYCMWISDDAPPPGCAVGHDAEPWKCGHVTNAVIFAVAREECGHAALPSQQRCRDLLGLERAADVVERSLSGQLIQYAPRAPFEGQPT